MRNKMRFARDINRGLHCIKLRHLRQRLLMLRTSGRARSMMRYRFSAIGGACDRARSLLLSFWQKMTRSRPVVGDVIKRGLLPPSLPHHHRRKQPPVMMTLNIDAKARAQPERTAKQAEVAVVLLSASCSFGVRHNCQTRTEIVLVMS